MAFQRHDYRTQAPQKYGKPTVTYPYGDTRFPRILEVRTGKKGTESAQLLPFLTAHRDQQSYPGAVLVEQTADCGDDTDKNISETYEVLPGPIFVEITGYRDTGIPMLVSRQRVAATADFTEGEIVPAALSVEAITDNGDGTCTVTVAAEHDLPPRAWVTLAGTDSTPSLDGNARIITVPAFNQVTVNIPGAGSPPSLSVAGTAAGTMVGTNRITRELKPLPSNASVVVKLDTMIAAEDVGVYNENIKCWKDYEFPDFLLGVNFYNDRAQTTGFESWNYHISWGGAVALPMQDGYRGPCRAQRQRYFFVGPPPDSFEEGLAPTFIMPSSGTFVIEGGSVAANWTPDLLNSTFSRSNSFRTGRIPHCLNGGVPTITTFAGPNAAGVTTGDSLATISVDMPPSVPARFVAGETITLMGQPTKYDAGALWEVIVWIITVPYTSGLMPSGFTYSTNPVVYFTGTGAIPTNSPTMLSGTASSFAISPFLPTGLSLNGANGDITGTPTEASARTIYTVTCSVAGVTQTAFLDLAVLTP
jgi:hypothetical protein